MACQKGQALLLCVPRSHAMAIRTIKFWKIGINCAGAARLAVDTFPAGVCCKMA